MKKMKKMKKMMSVVVALGVCVGLVSCGAKAGEPTKGGQDDSFKFPPGYEKPVNADLFEWSYYGFNRSEKEKLVIDGLTEKGKKQTELVIPKVCEAAHRLSRTPKEEDVYTDIPTNIKHISFENPDTILGDLVCSRLKSLETVELPANLKEIPEHAFSFCDNLKEIKIPDSVTKIGDSAFWGCENLEKVELGSGVREIGKSAFLQCSKLKRSAITGGITIPDEAFY